MNARDMETWLAKFTLCLLVVYFPVETLLSWPALWSPVLRYRSHRHDPAVVWCAGLAWGAAAFRSWSAVRGVRWTAANGWRASFDRLYQMAEGGQLDYGSAELCFVVGGTVLTLVCFGLSLWLVVRSSSLGDPRGDPSA